MLFNLADKYRNPYPCWLAKSNVSYNMGANSGCGILGLFAAVCVSLNAFINFCRKKKISSNNRERITKITYTMESFSFGNLVFIIDKESV